MRTIDFRYKILRGGAEYGFLHAAAGTAPTLRMQEGSPMLFCTQVQTHEHTQLLGEACVLSSFLRKDGCMGR